MFAIAATALLAGCQTSGYMTSAATDGDGVTCAEIYQAFDAYERDRQSAGALADLGGVLGPAAGGFAVLGVNRGSRTYEELKAGGKFELAWGGGKPIKYTRSLVA